MEGGRERAAVYALLLVWLLLPLVRIAAPHSHFYDANRHFIEYVPALGAIAGGGVALVGQWLRARWPGARGRWALGAGAALVLASLSWPVIEYHPYETAYFNVFAGGLGGAQRGGLFLTSPHEVASTAPRATTGTTRCAPACGTSRHSLPEGGRWASAARVAAKAGQPPRGEPAALLDGTSATAAADLVYAAPRPRECDWNDVRDIEVARPLLQRVEREGGLIYEVLAPGTVARVRSSPARPPTTRWRGRSRTTASGWLRPSTRPDVLVQRAAGDTPISAGARLPRQRVRDEPADELVPFGVVVAVVVEDVVSVAGELVPQWRHEVEAGKPERTHHVLEAPLRLVAQEPGLDLLPAPGRGPRRARSRRSWPHASSG